MSSSSRSVFETRDLTRPDLIAICLAVAVCLCVLLFRIDHPKYSQDELITLLFVRASWAELFGELWGAEVHRPYFYALQKAWISVTSEDRFAVRALNPILSALCLPLIFLIAKRISGRTAAYLAMCFLIFSPLFVDQSRAIRAYPLLNLSILSALVGLFAIIDIYRSPSGKTASGAERPVFPLLLWCVFVLGSASAFYAHSISIVFFALCALWALVAVFGGWISTRLFWHFVWAGLAYTIAILPGVVPLLFHVNSTLNNFWIHEPSLGYVYSQFLGAYPYPFWAKPIVFLLLGYGIWLLRHNRPVVLLLLFLIVGQPVALWLLSYEKPVLIVRVIAWPTLLSAVLFAVVVASLRRPLQLVIAAFILSVQIMAIGPTYPRDRISDDVKVFDETLATFDPANSDFVLGNRFLEPGLRWYYPQLFTSPVPAFEYADKIPTYELVFQSRLVPRKDAGTLRLEKDSFVILSEALPLYEIAEQDEVSAALEVVAKQGTLIDRRDRGNLRLEIYRRKSP